MTNPHYTFKRRCSKCATTYPETYEYFPPFPNGPLRLRQICIYCQEPDPDKRNAMREKLEKQKTSSRSQKLGLIYFIQSDYQGLIKIGITTGEIEQRINSMRGQSAAELKLLATMPGRREDESNLHNHFFDLNVHHEWFYPGEELLAFIHDIKKRK